MNLATLDLSQRLVLDDDGDRIEWFVVDNPDIVIRSTAFTVDPAARKSLLGGGK